eukprot:TRINITY_DN3240_c0_g1_i1.p1 TRINITY_DN3240_c0_g1~~TRINITY_DN3240_c0_g1_i1.p1  ORF type:complete len:239 (+),score=37.04 TRINITY_DN3240_c0_g1_i1:245-961(+)
MIKDPVRRITVNDAMQHPFIKLCDQSENIIFDDDNEKSSISLFMERNSTIKNKNAQQNLFSLAKINPKLKLNPKCQSQFYLKEQYFKASTSPTNNNCQINSLTNKSFNKILGTKEESYQQITSLNQSSMLMVNYPALQQLRSGGESSEDEVMRPTRLRKKDTFLGSESENEMPNLNFKPTQNSKLNKFGFQQKKTFETSQMRQQGYDSPSDEDHKNSMREQYLKKSGYSKISKEKYLN